MLQVLYELYERSILYIFAGYAIFLFLTFLKSNFIQSIAFIHKLKYKISERERERDYLFPSKLDTFSQGKPTRYLTCR